MIVGNDIHPGAVTLAGQGAETARVAGMIDVFRNNCEMFKLESSTAGSKIDPDAPKLVVTNPPWGKRIGAGQQGGGSRGGDRRRQDPDEDNDNFDYEDRESDRDTTVGLQGLSEDEALEQVWNSLGVFLKRECPDSLRLCFERKPHGIARHSNARVEKHVVGIGGVDCRLLRYDILPPKPPGYSPPRRRDRD